MSTYHLLPAELLERPIRIHVAGCGGNGSQMLFGLARLDRTMRRCGHPHGLQVCAFDPDHVTDANVGRQLFAPVDIGHNKAAVLITRINAYYEIHWEAIDRAWEPNGVTRPFAPGLHTLEWPDFLISCVDTARVRREMHHALTGSSCRIPYWLDLGNLQRLGQVVLGQPDTAWRRRESGVRLPTVTEILPELLDARIPEDNRPSCSVAEALESQSLFINDFISREALELLERFFRTGKTDYHAVFVNREDGQHPRVPIPTGIKPMAEKVGAA